MSNGAIAFATSPTPVEVFPCFERVLFTTDFSETSLRALPLAGAIARSFGSELRIMYVLTPGDEICTVPEFAPEVSVVVAKSAKERLSELKNSSDLQGLKVITEVYRGGLSSSSLNAAVDDADLVVMSTHGSKGVRHLLLGSVAEDMIHSAAQPIMTLGPHASVSTTSGFNPKHVLFATDATADSFRALPYAVKFAQKEGSGLTLVYVLRRGQDDGPQADAFAALMRDILHRTLPLTAIKSCNPEILVRFGSPAEEILATARERGSELIVMGARSNAKRGTFSRSVSYGVISQAACPVLTVRGRER